MPKSGAKPPSAKKNMKKNVSFVLLHEDDDQQADPLWVAIAKLTDAARDCSTPPFDAAPSLRQEYLPIAQPSLPLRRLLGSNCASGNMKSLHTKLEW